MERRTPLGAAPDTPHTQPLPGAQEPLTGRELLLLQLLARGYSLAQCARLAGATGTGALADVKRAAPKLGVHDTAAAVSEAHRLWLVL